MPAIGRLWPSDDDGDGGDGDGDSGDITQFPSKIFARRIFSACQKGQVKLTLLSHIQPSR